MANWCWNNIEFTGEEKNVENLYKLFQKTVDMQEKTEQAQILFGLEGHIDGYMFDIGDINLENCWLSLSFQSRWSPIPNDMVRIAELFDLQFNYDYEESGMGLHGKYTFKITDGEGTLYEQCASQNDIEKCRFKEEGDEEDEESGFDFEKLEAIIENMPMTSILITRANNKPVS